MNAAMGREAACTARFGGKSAAGKALLETKELVFRGDGLRLKIPFERIKSLEVAEGELIVKLPDGPAVFELGAQAAAWAAGSPIRPADSRSSAARPV